MSHPLDALRALERTLGGVAHDVSNPLAAIIGYAQLASVEADAARRGRYLEAVLSQAEAIRRLVNHLQSAASTTPAPDTHLRLSDVASLAALGAGQALGGKLSVDVEQDAEVQGDREALVNAVRCLLDNAAAAIAGLSDGRVVLRVARGQGQGSVSVLDNGPGFTAEARANAFTPDFTTRRTGNGIGLGLCVALAVAERHGGGLTVLPGGLSPDEVGRAGAGVQLWLPTAP